MENRTNSTKPCARNRVISDVARLRQSATDAGWNSTLAFGIGSLVAALESAQHAKANATGSSRTYLEKAFNWTAMIALGALGLGFAVKALVDGRKCRLVELNGAQAVASKPLPVEKTIPLGSSIPQTSVSGHTGTEPNQAHECPGKLNSWTDRADSNATLGGKIGKG